MHTDFNTSQLLGKEHALLICNHRSDMDWLIGWVLAQRAGCLGSALAIMKKERKILPSGFRQLEDFPMPFWLALFVEGTCFTQQKLALAQEFAASRGLPAPRNVLIPRTKLQKCTCFQLKYLQKKSPFLVFECAWLWGFVAAVSHMHLFVPAIYNCTISIPKDQPPPTMLRLFRGHTSVIRRHLMSELPETDDDASQWCKDVFVTKVVIFWFCLIVLGIVEFVGCSTLLSTWEGIAIAFSYLVLVTIIMQILIHSSESERSTPAKLSSEDPIKQSLIQKHAENNTTLAI